MGKVQLTILIFSFAIIFAHSIFALNEYNCPIDLKQKTEKQILSIYSKSPCLLSKYNQDACMLKFKDKIKDYEKLGYRLCLDENERALLDLYSDYGLYDIGFGIYLRLIDFENLNGGSIVEALNELQNRVGEYQGS